MFADSFNVLSIHCIVRGLAASCVKCPASCGSSCHSTAFLFTFADTLIKIVLLLHVLSYIVFVNELPDQSRYCDHNFSALLNAGHHIPHIKYSSDLIQRTIHNSVILQQLL